MPLDFDLYEALFAAPAPDLRRLREAIAARARLIRAGVEKGGAQ